MARAREFQPRTSTEKEAHARFANGIKAYGSPRQVWVEDGYVLVEGVDGSIVSLTPEVAIDIGRTISEAGTQSLVSKVLNASKIDKALSS